MIKSFFGRSSVSRRLVYWVLARAPKGLALPILKGPLRGALWLINSGNYSCWLGTYEKSKQAAFAAELSSGAVVFDIGAHVGFYSLMAAALTRPGGRVFAFEPLRRNVMWLRQHVALNKARVEIIEAAVADWSGTSRFRIGPDSYTGTLDDEGEEVAVVAIDALYASGRLSLPHVIKIDVEGSEALVLRGAKSTITVAHPVIFLAVHGGKAHNDCIDLLNEFGYQVDELVGDSIETHSEFIARPIRDFGDNYPSPSASPA